MKVLHIVPTFYPATYWGGPIFSTLGLCDALAAVDDVDLRVLTTDASGPGSGDRLTNIDYEKLFPSGYTVYYCKKTFGHEFSIELLRYLVSMVRWADIVHLTYTYSPPTIPTLLICRLLGCPVVWSPRGALQRWEGTTRPLAKRIWEAICNVLVVKKMTVLHVTSTEEAQASSRRIPRADLATISNGVLIPDVYKVRNWRPDNRLRIMYMGRLHPIKGLENLLQSIALLKCTVNISLDIYGEGAVEYRSSLKKKVADLQIQEFVTFHGSVSGEEKESAFFTSDLCVLPSFSENFGMVVAEALAHGVPVIASKGSPWEKLEEYNCGLWVDNTPEIIASAIDQLLDKNLETMGMNGRNWMELEYSWVHIASQMYTLYFSLIKNKN